MSAKPKQTRRPIPPSPCAACGATMKKRYRKQKFCNRNCMAVDGVVHLPCSRCEKVLPETDFHAGKNSDGRASTCRPCHAAACHDWWANTADKLTGRLRRREFARRPDQQEKQRIRNRGRPQPYTQKVAARAAVRNALASGRLVKPQACSRCGGGGRICAHHHDYTKKLEVEWLCPVCHAEEHSPLPPPRVR